MSLFSVIIFFVFFFIFIGVIALIVLLIQKSNKKNAEQIDVDSKNITTDNYINGYNSKWMFSYNEKDAFRKIKSVTDKLNYYLFAKVRLYDLVEPKKGVEKYRTLQYKIQAKHVDFVVCDEKLVARTIIELDDSSHNSKPRKERDTFVDQVLTNCGYKVLRYIAINTDTLENDLNERTST